MKLIYLSFITLSVIYAINHPPVIPDIATSQLVGDTTKPIDFVVQTTDPESDHVSYEFDWGDGTTSEWLTFTNSGYEFSASHQYKTPGIFLCRARAKDSLENISDWSSSCTLTIVPTLLKWQYDTEAGIFSSVALGSANEIYFTCENGTLHSLNPDGSLRWQFQTLGSIYSAPVVGKQAIYLTSTDGSVYSISYSGTENWRFKTDKAIYSTPALSKDAVYVGCDDGNLYAIAHFGKLLWKYQTGDEIVGSPTIGKDGTIYTASDAIYALTPNGKKKWRYQPPEDYETYFFASPALGSDGTIYLGGTDGALYAITNNGRLKFRAPTPDEDEIRACVVLDKNDVAYFGAQDGILYKKEKYGEVTQLFETDYYIFSTPALDTLRNIYFVSDDGFFYCLRPDGKLLYKWEIAQDTKEIEMMFSSSPIIADDGTVYVGSWEGKLFAFNGFAPPLKSSWPMFRANQQNTGRLER